MSEKDEEEKQQEKKQEKKEENKKSPQDQNSKGEVEIEFLSPQGKTKKSQKEGEEKKKQVPQGKNKLEKKEKEINKLKKEIEEAKEEQLRQLAEKENLRKRMEREKNDYYQYALSEFIKDLLVVLDNFERALETESKGSEKDFKEGIEMIHKQFKDVLKKQGVRLVETKDKEFDPKVQQALITEESDKVDRKEVSEVMQKGYMLHDRLLRPALVKVAVPKKKDKEEEKKEEKED
ncbi:nucleotide exchange factor GrpE [bacterium]|nr:nucleotide exchange factor GrpE [bacterium]